MISNPFQRKAYDAVAAALPFAIDPAKITVEPGVSYLPSAFVGSHFRCHMAIS
jgi:hypothetical protein